LRKGSYKSLADVNNHMMGLLVGNFFEKNLISELDLEPDIYPRHKRPDPEMIPN